MSKNIYSNVNTLDLNIEESNHDFEDFNYSEESE